MTKTEPNRIWGENYEKKIIKELGGRHVPGSGSTAELKEDGDFPGMKLQVKGGQGKSISIQAKDLSNLQENALNCGKVPVLFFGMPYQNEEWIAFPKWFMRNSALLRDLALGIREEEEI